VKQSAGKPLAHWVWRYSFSMLLKRRAMAVSTQSDLAPAALLRCAWSDRGSVAHMLSPRAADVQQ
jgi:hypothetical protein